MPEFDLDARAPTNRIGIGQRTRSPGRGTGAIAEPWAATTDPTRMSDKATAADRLSIPESTSL